MGKRFKERQLQLVDTDAALLEFIRENRDFLTSQSFTKKRYKIQHHNFFFGRLKKRCGMPSLKVVLTAFVAYLKKNGLPKETILNYIETLPVFNEAGQYIREECANLCENDEFVTTLSKDEINLLKSVDSYEALKEHKGREIERTKEEELKHLEEEIELRKQEYLDLPSILDGEDIQEPEFDPIAEDVKPWWERFYLKSNPFSNKDGLSSIDQSLYESVVVKTKPFVDTISALNRNPRSLLNTASLLIGHFGFGKTTFIDYLSFILIQKNILPLRITCGKQFADSSGFLDHLYIKLLKALRHQLTIRESQAISDFEQLDIESQITEASKQILRGRWQGIVVFLDDYHKHHSAFKQIYEFLGLLQIIKDELTRQDAGVGFIVSGLPEWKEELPTNPQMTGFFDSPLIEMPEITAESVCAVFDQRIKAYCYDEHPRKIKINFVKNIIKQVGGHSGYRNYLNAIITELENNNLAIVNSPIAIDNLELSKIKLKIESDGALKAAFNKLTLGSFFKKYTKEQVAKCVEILVQIGLQEGISESDVLFLDNKYYFLRLNEVILIQKKRDKTPKSFKWVLHHRLQKVTDEIQDEFKRQINDYLLKIYGWKEGVEERESQNKEIGELKEIKAFFNRKDITLPKSVQDNLALAFQSFDSIAISNDTKEQQSRSILRANDAIQNLSTAFFEIDQSVRFYKDASISRLENRWHLHWFNDETLTEFFNRRKEYERKPTKLNYDLTINLAKGAFQILGERLKSLTEEICCPTTSQHLLDNPVSHNDKEILILERVKTSYFSAERDSHFDYIEEVTNYLEERFRDFLYATSYLVFGEKYFEEVPGVGSKKYAYKNLSSRTNYSSLNNSFNGFTRPQFRQIFQDKNNIKSRITDALNLPWIASDWNLFFNMFGDENIKTSHKQRDAYSPQDRNRYIAYCKRVEELTSHLNRLTSHVITNNSFIFPVSGEDKELSNVVFKYAFKLDDKKKENADQIPKNRVVLGSPEFISNANLLFEHKLALETFNKIQNMILNKIDSSKSTSWTEDILDVEYIVSHYDASYADFISTIVYMNFVTEEVQVFPWFGSLILLKRRPTPLNIFLPSP